MPPLVSTPARKPESRHAAAFACGIALAASALFAGESIRNHFDSDATMREPGYFDLVVLGAPGAALWRILAEVNPPSAPNALGQVFAERPTDSIAAAIRRNVLLKDGSLSVSVKKTPGKGGILFRAADDKNFLVLLVDPSTSDARLIQYRQGRASELARGRPESGREWGVLAIKLAGPKITATWEGKPLLMADDPAPVEGRTGLATSGPGLTTFDEFLIDPAAAAAPSAAAATTPSR